VKGLDPTEQERTQLREALLRLAACSWTYSELPELLEVAAGLAETAQDRGQVLEALLGLLAAPGNSGTAETLAGLATGLAETAQERAQVREALLRRLAAPGNPRMADPLAPTITSLRPIAWDLVNWQTPSSLPTVRLLAAVRKNSVLADWLAVLPSFSSLPG
jgi:hypothetical protein